MKPMKLYVVRARGAYNTRLYYARYINRGKPGLALGARGARFGDDRLPRWAHKWTDKKVAKAVATVLSSTTDIRFKVKRV